MMRLLAYVTGMVNQHDGDTKFCAEFRKTLQAGGVKCLRLPRPSPNLNAFAERAGMDRQFDADNVLEAY